MALLSREILTHIVLGRGGPSPRSTPLRLRPSTRARDALRALEGRGPCAPRRSRLRTDTHARGAAKSLQPARGVMSPSALALASELVYGTPVSTRDPARFAFAHGGKDGIPFPVDRPTYDRTIDVLRRAVDRARVDRSERIRALKRLAAFHAS
ncbi:MAG: DUF763 domain-containing protein [Acidobacteria bacterium]|nr:MAG: DUF763 domain-containing protein [Acidobacteriota bacterium]